MDSTEASGSSYVKDTIGSSASDGQKIFQNPLL